MAQHHWLAKFGLVVGVAGSVFVLGACSRPGGGTNPTATPAVTVRTSPSVSRTPTRATTAATPTTAPAPSAAPAAPTQPPAPPAATATATKAAASGQKYVVKPDDTLSGIAEQFGVTVQELVDANKLENPNLLLPGQELIIPGR